MIRRGIAAVMALIMMSMCCSGALAASALPADFLAQTENGLYFKLDDMLIYVNGDEADLAGSGSIAAVAALGEAAYCLQYGEDYALDLVQYVPGSEAQVLYEFQASDRVSNLTAKGEELFLLLNDQLHVFYPSNGMCIKLANTAIAEYVWLNDMIYFVSSEETVEHTMDSLLGGQPVVKKGGALYSLDVNTGNMVRMLNTGVEDLRAGGDLLYFHDLSDAYVMGTADEEWLEGRVYSLDPATKQKTRVVDGYDWGFYPMNDGVVNGVVIYTADGVSKVQADGTLQTLLQPQGVINAVSTDEALFVFDQTENVLYRYDGRLDVVAASRLGALLTEAGRTVRAVDVPEISVEPTVEATVEATAEATAEATENPTEAPTAEPTQQPTQAPTATPTAAPTVTPTVKPTQKVSNDGEAMDGSYIFPNSDTKKLTKAEIKAVDEKLWAYGRNEIFARHGYYFGEGNKYQKYFDQKSWYRAGDFSTSELSSIEWYNMQLLKEMEGIDDSSSSTSSGTSSGYIFANSSKKKLTREQILSIDKNMWGYARNEIYARHGYSFKTAKYRNYFKKKSWYKEGGFSTGDLNSVEWYNMNLIKKMEKEYGVK